MRELWRRFEDWFAKNVPEADLRLRPPATKDEVTRAEAILGVEFPADFVESLLVHDGQEDDPNVFWLPAGQRLGSLASLVDCWQRDRPSYEDDPERWEWLDSGECTRQVHFHPKHIPIAGSRFWDYERLLLDFVPGPKGRPGQVIARADVEFVIVAKSWREVMEKTVSGLENGRIRLDPLPPEIGSGWEIEYLSPRAKKPMPMWKFFG